MRRYVITITMRDGSQGTHPGLYHDGVEAVMEAMGNFPDAKRISARREHEA
ncbi:MAG: hypothetical protein V4858_08950 [Pseudomonadota bacterium]